MSFCRLIVLAKEPVSGRVKTRLCPPFSAAQAAELAAAALADTLVAVFAAVAAAGTLGHVVSPVLVLDGAPGPWLDELLAGSLEGSVDLPVLTQREGGLDARIAAAFKDAGMTEQVDSIALLIGMDTPQVTSRMLASAIDTLALPESDAVLGLAEDGGWWALGLHKADDSLLLGVPMSTPETGHAQLDRLTSAGLCVTILPTLRDVDTAADAIAAAELAPRSRFAATLKRLARLARPAPAPAHT